MTAEEKKSLPGTMSLMTVATLYLQHRQKTEKAGTFHLKPPLPDEEVPPYLRERIPCINGCERTFRIDTSLRRAKDGVAPDVSLITEYAPDGTGTYHDSARVKCRVCDLVYRAPAYTVQNLRERLRNGEIKDSFYAKWLRVFEAEQAEEDAVARVTTIEIILGQNLTTDQPVTVTAEEMCSGTYVLGTQGAGKSSLLEQVTYQRMEQSDSIIVLDPHGQLVDNIIARMPQERIEDTYLLDLTDTRLFPFCLNVFYCADCTDETERARTRGRVLRVFRRIWPEIESGQYAEKILRYVTNTLIYNPDCTLADVPDWFRHPRAISAALRNVGDAQTRAFWEHDLPSLSSRERSIQTEPFLNRLGRLLADDLLRRLLCKPGPPLDVKSIIRGRRILLVKLPVDSDTAGEAASLVGVALFSLIYAATFDEQNRDWRDTYTLIVDEFQNFVTNEFVKLFVGGRKYGAKLVLAHQYTNQLDQPGLDVNRRGVLTARNVVAFHTTPYDASEVAPLFAQLDQQTDNLVADVVASLERHPNEAVKQFGLRTASPLVNGSRLQLHRSSATEEEPYTIVNGRKMYYSSHSARQVYDTTQYPQLDFGFGTVPFDPEDARQVRQQLNSLLYEAQKTGRINPSHESRFIEGMATLSHREDSHLRSDEKTRMEADLRVVIDALINEPLIERLSITGGGEILTQLPALPSRTAFVKAGERTYQMETYPLPPEVDGSTARKRVVSLLERTRWKYCSTREEVDERIASSPCRHSGAGGQMQPPSGQSPKYEVKPPSPVPPQPPIRRRSPSR
ncbi:hypothetical protein [Streptomyces nymphaeiformis]|uniref:Type IV secretion system coupling protein TraD DNA-binding domain-containing protein n=1 Tax=Streptomyces nymphaeiformis TaxID=2663842 RepID=A0A7W7XET2_9ACTN|nr:hypothetical protein [Streptomyces nymphaeiformis]MBB4984781.1 hypothetical protein [Streptomyces nymphaeiformis]